MYGCYVICGLAFALGLWNLTIAILGCIPRCRKTAVGTLTKAQTWKNIKARGGGLIPFLTKYRYVYTVGSKTYTFNWEARHNKRKLFPKTTMVYVVGFPRHAYPNRFTGIREWIWSYLGLLIGVLFLLVCIRGW
jgi:hypothetical protein